MRFSHWYTELSLLLVTCALSSHHRVFCCPLLASHCYCALPSATTLDLNFSGDAIKTAHRGRLKDNLSNVYTREGFHSLSVKDVLLAVCFTLLQGFIIIINVSTLQHWNVSTKCWTIHHLWCLFVTGLLSCALNGSLSFNNTTTCGKSLRQGLYLL